MVDMCDVHHPLMGIVHVSGLEWLRRATGGTRRQDETNVI